ncbi:hypothetical protein [Spirosoma spitsbergense]|uniref:hypothetical protein n=1 Tax=Spirosoma spitsbergense TaxID=431554 RepID=UPI0003726E12|nr:hypothetical protein [Spirosoma spitsbergense]
MKGIRLLPAALVLAIIFYPIGVVYALLNAVREGSLSKIIGYLDKVCLRVALSIDTMGNTICMDMLNGWLRKQPGYEFGNYRETISRVLGKNEQTGTLTKAGRGLANVLNKIDPGHTQRAAKDSAP